MDIIKQTNVNYANVIFFIPENSPDHLILNHLLRTAFDYYQ
jgi:hypothetical protein